MPLSKARDAERKRLERAKNRLDKQLRPPAGSEPIQPRHILDAAKYLNGALVPTGNRMLWFDGKWYESDADGNPIPDY